MSQRLVENKHSTRMQWMAILFLFVGGSLVGLVGYMIAIPPTGPTFSPNWWTDVFDNIYRILLLFTLNATPEETNLNWMTQVARFMAPAATLSALAKILIQAAYSKAILSGLKRSGGHIVIAGFGHIGQHFARHYAGGKARVVVIDPNPDEEMRALADQLGVPLLIGDATQWPVLDDAGIRRAAHLFATTDDEALNIEIATQAAHMKNEDHRDDRTLSLHVHLSDREMEQKLADFEVSLERISSNRIAVNFFGVDQLLARQLVAEHPLHRMAWLGGQDHIHMVVLGFSHLAEEVLLQTVLTGHFKGLGRPKFTFLVPPNSDAQEGFETRNPTLGAIADVTFEEHEDIHLLKALKAITAKQPVTATFIANSLGRAAGRLALDILAAARVRTVRPGLILIRDDATSGFLNMVASGTPKITSGMLVPFGLKGGETLVSAVVGDGDRLARAVHEAYTKLHGDEADTARLAKTADKGWTSLPETYRRANRRAADHIAVKLESAGFRVSEGSVTDTGLSLDTDFMKDMVERERMARLEHDRWSADRIVDGWSFGEPRDNLRKKHPMLVAFDDLSQAEKDKDAEQVEFLRDVLVRIGHETGNTTAREAVFTVVATDGTDSHEVLSHIQNHAEGRPITILSPCRAGTEAALIDRVLATLPTDTRLITFITEPDAREITLPDAKPEDTVAADLWARSWWLVDMVHDDGDAKAAMVRAARFMADNTNSESFVEGDDALATALRTAKKA